MGKGHRIRANRFADAAPHEIPLAKAASLEKNVHVLTVIAVIILLLCLPLPIWSLSIVSDQLSLAAYTAEETAALTPLLPLGQLSLVLIALGTVLTAVLLWLRKPVFSCVCMVPQIAGCALLVTFAIGIANVFPFDPIELRGLNFWDLVLRYYILLLPAVMLTVSVCMSFVARKKRYLADIMLQASDTTSTLTLDEDEQKSDDFTG